jgi:imidazolonepropionase-like amidohydrolase
MVAHLRLVLALLLVMPAIAVSAADGEPLIIGPVHVVSMDSGAVTPDQAVLIEHGRIQHVGDWSATGRPSGARLIDGRNGYLIPGLAEMHAHVPPVNRGEQHARDILMLYLANGVTLARGMLGEPWHLQLREQLATGEWTGPRLITSGPSFNGRSVSSPQQAAAMVRRQAEAGYDFLKLHPGLEPDEFQAIAAAAEAVRLTFAGHVSFAVGLQTALQSRQATIDHLDGYAEALVPEQNALHGVRPEWFGVNLAAGMDPLRVPALAAATASAGVWNVPTQTLLEHTLGERSLDELLARPSMAYVSEPVRERWVQAVTDFRARIPLDQRRAFVAIRRQLLDELQKAGAGLLLGSDAPQIMNVPGFSVHEELALMVAAGLTPLQALQSGTLNVARFLGETDSGAVRVGFVADLILLERNPLEDIRATRHILGVARSGHWIGRAELDRALQAIAGRGI